MKLTSEPQEQKLLERSLPVESTGISDLLNRVKPKPETTLLLLAVLIGMGAGAGVVLFRTLIHFIHGLMFGEVSSFFSPWGHWTLALIPLLGGMLIGLLRWRMQDFGPGLAKLMEVVQGNREVMLLNPVTKMVAASISLGSGASLGPEGPSVEIGAYFSLLLGKGVAGVTRATAAVAECRRGGRSGGRVQCADRRSLLCPRSGIPHDFCGFGSECSFAFGGSGGLDCSNWVRLSASLCATRL